MNQYKTHYTLSTMGLIGLATSVIGHALLCWMFFYPYIIYYNEEFGMAFTVAWIGMGIMIGDLYRNRKGKPKLISVDERGTSL